ncbi:uncharacterized protein LOC142554268 [Primulina tabacum]|uniref:uncharacterized protein LOC142554268 n=1 Tax=Primulina tabacum TaxID=48773 RepID=UPI003F59D86C
MVPWENVVTVHNLIKDGAWDADLLYSSLNPYVAGEIIKIPLSTAGKCDALYWRFDVKGKYYVREGCRLQRVLFDPPTHESTHPFEDWWSFIWSLFVPPKQYIYEQFGEKQKFLHGDKWKPAIENIPWSSCSAMLSEFQKARIMETIACPSERGSQEKTWKPPRSSTLKFNVDVAVDEDRNQYSVDGVVRDIQGRLLLAFGKQINQPIFVAHVEFLAIQKALNSFMRNVFKIFKLHQILF